MSSFFNKLLNKDEPPAVAEAKRLISDYVVDGALSDAKARDPHVLSVLVKALDDLHGGNGPSSSSSSSSFDVKSLGNISGFVTAICKHFVAAVNPLLVANSARGAAATHAIIPIKLAPAPKPTDGTARVTSLLLALASSRALLRHRLLCRCRLTTVLSVSSCVALPQTLLSCICSVCCIMCSECGLPSPQPSRPHRTTGSRPDPPPLLLPHRRRHRRLRCCYWAVRRI
jgi:hypothetical protein